MVSDAREYYDQQRSIGTIWGVVLPSWDELTWDEKIDWENKLNEQLSRDEER